MRKLPSGKSGHAARIVDRRCCCGAPISRVAGQTIASSANDPARGDVPDTVVEAIGEEITAIDRGRGAVYKVDLRCGRRPTIPRETGRPCAGDRRDRTVWPNLPDTAAPRLGPHKATVGCGEMLRGRSICASVASPSPVLPEMPFPATLHRTSVPPQHLSWQTATGARARQCR